MLSFEDNISPTRRGTAENTLALDIARVNTVL